MKPLFYIAATCALSACFNYESDLADCFNAGRCTYGAGGGTGFTGGGTGFTGGGTGFTGGGTGFTGGGTGSTGGGTPLRTDCPTLADVALKPTFYNYYSSGGFELTESHYQADSGTALSAQVIWRSSDVGTGVDGNTLNEHLDGAYNPNRNITLTSGSKDYQLLSGTLSLNTSQSGYGSMSGTISAGYFYNSENTDECFFVSSISFNTDTSVICEPLTADCFTGGSANFSSGPGYASTWGSAFCTSRILYMQVNWQTSGMDIGVFMPSTYSLAEPPIIFPVQTYIQQSEPDGGSTILFGEAGSFHLANASRDAGGVFQTSIANVLFYNRRSGIRTDCLSLASQTYDFTY